MAPARTQPASTRQRPRRGWRPAALLSAFLLAACTSAPAPAPSASPSAPPSRSAAPTIGPAARAYLESALDIVQQHALNRARLDWPYLRRRALRIATAAGAKKPADVYVVLRLTLGNLDDNSHSTLIPPAATDPPASGPTPPAGAPLARSVYYLALPGAQAFRNANRRYLAAADAIMARADRRGTCGWIVDLRDNPGGDVWPMLVAAEPLLGTATVGYFVAPGEPRIPVRMTRSAAYVGGTVAARALTAARPDFGRAAVAVITGPHTASSGEFVAIAFRGRRDTRSFGLPTSGVPTSNASFRLSDGAVLVLTTAQDADRTGAVYPDAPVGPDQEVAAASPTATSSGADPAIAAARRWLSSQEHCA